MPGMNQRGPLNKGPLTGRGTGMCRRTETLSLKGLGKGGGANRGSEQGGGTGRGSGKGNRRRVSGTSGQRARSGFAAASECTLPPFKSEPVEGQKTEGGAPAPSDELSELKQQYENARDTLEQLAARIDELENS